MTKRTELQGTAVALGETGILIRGPVGAGKSLLALSLIDQPPPSLSTKLIADDLVIVTPRDHGLMLCAPEACRGQIELRYFGIVERPFREKARLGLVVDFTEDAARLPEPEQCATQLLEHKVPCATVPLAPRLELFHQMAIVRSALARLGG